MSIRAYADNCVVVLEPLPTETASGIQLVNMSKNTRGTRRARVLASGPGYVSRLGHLIPNEAKAGDTVLVDALAGQPYALDLNAPRQNKSAEFQELLGESGEFRIIRHDEILCVVEDDAKAAE